MTDSRPTARAPRVFDADDPSLKSEPDAGSGAGFAPHAPSRQRTERTQPSTDDGRGAEAGDVVKRPGRRWLGWGHVLLGALAGLIVLSATMWLVDFLFAALARSDWIGLAAWGLTALAALAAVMLVMRELIGLLRLARLSQVRQDADRVRRSSDPKLERSVVRRLQAALSGRRDVAWSLARFREHEADVRDPGDLLALADREIMAPLDSEARHLILNSAKRVSVATALSPIAFIAIGFVLIENLSLLRRLAGLYGGRPGVLGSLRLARLVMVHMIATGGVALTDDLIGQFIGQDLVRRLSRRLGEGLINGALTARVGAAAVEVIRPIPFVTAPPVRMRDMVGEFLRRSPAPGSTG